MRNEEINVKDALALYEIHKPHPCAVKKSGSVDPCWGLDCVFLNDKDIKALMDGKVLYFSDGEYAHLIVREEE